MSTVYRIHWTPGTDRLLAVCHCTSWREVDDPISAWEWLLAHPEGHDPTGGPAARHPDEPAARHPDEPAADLSRHRPAAAGSPRP